MKTIVQRCKHCKQSYTYQISGNGCLDKYNDKDYCLNCKKSIVDALNETPQRYEGIYKEIPFDEELFSTFQEIKESKERNDNFFSNLKVTVPLDYDIIELYNYNNNSYALCRYKDDEKCHLLLLSEFDLEREEFTVKNWNDGTRCRYRKGMPMCRTFENFKVEPINVPPPNGNLYYQDFINMFL